jgi:hypothetical protein
MNPLNLFKYLEKEKGIPVPLRLKLIHGLPLTPEDLNVKGYLHLSDSKITSLPKGLKVGGSLHLQNCKNLTSLPEDLEIGGHLDLKNTPITSLPQGLKVEESLYMEKTPIKYLPSDLYVGGDLVLYFSPLAKKQTWEIREMVKTGRIGGTIYRY